jgi:hypothetical protein
MPYIIIITVTKLIKVKSPYLINYSPRHEDVWGSGGIAPPFLTWQ